MNYIKNNYDEIDDPFENDYPNQYRVGKQYKFGSFSDNIDGYCIPWDFDMFPDDDDCRNNYGL